MDTLKAVTDGEISVPDGYRFDTTTGQLDLWDEIDNDTDTGEMGWRPLGTIDDLGAFEAQDGQVIFPPDAEAIAAVAWQVQGAQEEGAVAKLDAELFEVRRQRMGLFQAVVMLLEGDAACVALDEEYDGLHERADQLGDEEYARLKELEELCSDANQVMFKAVGFAREALAAAVNGQTASVGGG